MYPFVHLSIYFGYIRHYRVGAWSNCLVLYTSRYILSSPAAFLFLIFLSTESCSSCVNCPSLMPSWLLIIFVIHSWVIFGGLPSKCSKCCFHRCICSSWLAAFSLTLAVLFLLHTSFTVYNAIQDCQSSTESLILSIWFCVYSVSFRYVLVNLFCVFLCPWALIMVGFLLVHFEAVFTSACFLQLLMSTMGLYV